MLDSSAVCLPAVSLSDEDIVVVVAPEAWEPGAHALFGAKLLFYSHSDCLSCLNGGRVPEFMDGPFAELRFVLVSERVSHIRVPVFWSEWGGSIESSRVRVESRL